jgi:hypothetical protein
LHRRLGRLVGRGKSYPKAITAVARELAGFVWAIGQQEQLITAENPEKRVFRTKGKGSRKGRRIERSSDPPLRSIGMLASRARLTKTLIDDHQLSNQPQTSKGEVTARRMRRHGLGNP